jgi:hypothetical protein
MKKTGWPPGLLQDDCRKLHKWFASRPDARYVIRKLFGDPTVTSLPYQQSLFALQAQLAVAIAECKRYARPAHAVRNCPSDLQNEDQAWRKRQNIEFQIRQLTQGE